MSSLHFLLACCLSATALSEPVNAPSGLLVDLKPSPHAGVDRPRPHLTWIVPHLAACASTGQTQQAFHVQHSSSKDFNGDLLKDTGRVESIASTLVAWTGLDLEPSSVHWWRVRTWSHDGCLSSWSEPAKIITGMFAGNFTAAKPIWAAGAQYAFLRHIMKLDKPVASAHVYVAAAQEAEEERLLGAYRLYLDGHVVGTGPGRGETVYSDPGHTPYDTFDITDLVSGQADVVVSLQGYHHKGDDSAKIVAELHVHFADGTQQILGTDSTWQAFNADALFNPTSNTGGDFSSQPREYIDARRSPSGDGCQTCWRLPAFTPTAAWQPAVERAAFSPLLAKTTQPIQVIEGIAPVRIVQVAKGHWFFDFGTEVMAGITLEWNSDPKYNLTEIDLRMGEELTSNTSILYPMRTTNNYQMTWTAGPGNSSFEQHEYFLFRYGEINYTRDQEMGEDDTFGTGLPFKLTAWVVRYPWVESDSAFESSDSTLNAVWGLCRNTLKVTSLDTTTDSNTRERLPYEADAFITGTSRYVFQREYTWQRHSTKHNMLNPTWPTEWRQTIPLLMHADYMMTGEIELSKEVIDILNVSTQARCIDSSSQLVNFSQCSRETGTRDIVDWPMDARDGYVLTNVNTVVNAYAVGALKAFAVLLNVSGNTLEAQRWSAQAEATAKAMTAELYEESTGLFLDGRQNDGSPVNHSAWHAQVFPLFFGVGNSADPRLLAFFKTKRMVGSVYAAFAFVLGLYRISNDHGAFALDMLTTCDKNSWCNMLKQGATATMEAWTREEKPNLSWSHPWASAAATAIARGVMGITALLPGFEHFKVQPQPGSLAWGKIKLPTLRGFIEAKFDQAPSEFTLTLTVPGNTVSIACLPSLGVAGTGIVVDGVVKTGYAEGDYVCISGIGSGSHSISRKASDDVSLSFESWLI